MLHCHRNARGSAAFILVVLVVATGSIALQSCTSPGGSSTGPATPAVDATDTTILFGDFHAHTTISFDASAWSLPVLGGNGFELPMDACEFARHCAGLDFWSINDHAEFTFQEDWRQIKEAIRACNASYGGDTADPEMVSYVGWEWSQIDTDERENYGHRNVIFPNTGEDDVPVRPIGSGVRANVSGGDLRPEQLGLFLIPLIDPANPEYNNWFLGRALQTVTSTECPPDVPVRDLPLDCQEGTVTPEGLFAKLDDWGFDSIVIPHSGAWGFHNPPLHNWVHQLNATHHDPERELMIEIYSGHGNSEQWRPFVPFVRVSEDETICPEAAPDYEPCCRRAGEAILTRDPACIDDPDSPACAAAVDAARQAWIEASFDGRYLFDKDWPDRPLTDDELGDCGQCRDCDFNPAFSYTPNGTVQATLALANVDETDADGDPLRYRFGLIGSTDEHQGKPGVGYKEAKRFSDIFGPVDASLEPLSGTIDATAADWERQGSFWFGGGRIAVHSDSRSREDIWDALKTKRVYATSGRNILLWFDAVVAGASDPVFMGETLRARTSPTFRVKAVGDWVQEPGCPEEVHEAMGDAFVEDICLGECYNPGTERFPIDRIEVVRIRPQVTGDEPLGDLIDDPWRVLPCDGSTEGCEVTFTDPDFAASGRSALYYVRAIHPEEPVLNGGQLRCRGIEGTRCTEIRPCEPGYRGEGDDCLAPAQHRAWSSPIFVDWDA